MASVCNEMHDTKALANAVATPSRLRNFSQLIVFRADDLVSRIVHFLGAFKHLSKLIRNKLIKQSPPHGKMTTQKLPQYSQLVTVFRG